MQTERIVLGRKKELVEKLGKKFLMLLGKELETGKFVYMDCAAPHVIFVCGIRGSGKSYTLGVIAEELVRNNPNVAVLIIDPLGVFWAMKQANVDEEIKRLKEYGLVPQGFKTSVFVPYALKSRVPKSTFDKTFSIAVNELSIDEWCSIFDIKRFSPQALLLEKAIKSLEGQPYSVDELIEECEKVAKQHGFKEETVSAVISKLESSKEWGFLDKRGTELFEICKEGEISVIDASFLSESLYCLITGIFARKILEARKLATRASDTEELTEVLIPPTWVILDEAHTLVPSDRKTAASESLIEFVKQGRKPGCSLVLATQQPSAVSSKLLSQIDMLISHKLSFEDDIKAVLKRFPCKIPENLRNEEAFRNLDVGECIIGEKVCENAFLAKIRPRMSRHEGRDVLATGNKKLSKREAFQLLKNLLIRRKMSKEDAIALIERVEKRYDVSFTQEEKERLIALAPVEKIVKRREKKENSGKNKKAKTIEGMEANYEKAKKLAEKYVKRSVKIGFLKLGDAEEIKETKRVLYPVWKVVVARKIKKGVVERIELYIDDRTGKVLNLRGFPHFEELSEEKKLKFSSISVKRIKDSKLKEKPKLSAQKLKRVLSKIGEVCEISKIYREVYRFLLESESGKKRWVEIDEFLE